MSAAIAVRIWRKPRDVPRTIPHHSRPPLSRIRIVSTASDARGHDLEPSSEGRRRPRAVDRPSRHGTRRTVSTISKATASSSPSFARPSSEIPASPSLLSAHSHGGRAPRPPQGSPPPAHRQDQDGRHRRTPRAPDRLHPGARSRALRPRRSPSPSSWPRFGPTSASRRAAAITSDAAGRASLEYVSIRDAPAPHTRPRRADCRRD